MSLRKLFFALVMLFGMGAVQAAPVDINSADPATLETLVGIGPKLAQAIIDYRTANGPFNSVDELAQVPGIGLKFIERNRESIVVNSGQ